MESGSTLSQDGGTTLSGVGSFTASNPRVSSPMGHQHVSNDVTTGTDTRRPSAHPLGGPPAHDDNASMPLTTCDRTPPRSWRRGKGNR